MIVVLFSQEKGLRDLCLPVTKFSPPFSFAARRQTNFSLDDAHHSIIVLYEKTCSRHSAPMAYSQKSLMPPVKELLSRPAAQKPTAAASPRRKSADSTPISAISAIFRRGSGETVLSQSKSSDRSPMFHVEHRHKKRPAVQQPPGVSL